MTNTGRPVRKRSSHRPNHKKLVEELYRLLDEASVEYDRDFDVVDDFRQYCRDWQENRPQAIA